MKAVQLTPGLGLRASIVIGLLLVSTAALADNGLAQLDEFVRSTQSAEGEFEQTVLSRSGRKPQQASGKFAYSRPGRFHWEYGQPYRQVLIGDGNKLWTWDPDLNQVTVREIGDALGSTPAAILFGSEALDQRFELRDAGEADGLAWVEATPKQTESGFEALRLGLRGGQLRRMEMRDSFGQMTVIDFVRLQGNPQLSADRFSFTPPAGADVIGDASPALAR